MPLPKFSNVSNFELSSSDLWSVTFDHPDLKGFLPDGSFPATDVTFMGGKPLIYENEICAEVPLTVYYGHQPPTAVSITFVDNVNAQVSKAINSWIKGNLLGITTAKSIRRSGYPVNKKGVGLTIVKYNDRGEVIAIFKFDVLCPNDEVQYQYTNSSEPMSFQIQFKIIGAIT